MPIWSIRLFIILSFFLFLFDVLIEFNTAFYMHGNLITKKSKIAKHYMKNNFLFDIIAVLKNHFIYSYFQS